LYYGGVNVNKTNGYSDNQGFPDSELLKEIKSNNEKEFWLLEYQSIILQFTRYIGLYFLVFVVYLGIQGLLFLTIVHFNIDSSVKLSLIVFALICCMLFFFCIIVATTIVQKVEARKEKALTSLGFEKNEVEDEFSIGHATSLVYLVFNLFLLCIFCLILYQYIQSG
jgi:hypothetical protein